MNHTLSAKAVQHIGIGPVDTGAMQSGYLASGLFVSVDDLFFRTARRAWRHLLARAENENVQIWAGIKDNRKTYLDHVTFAFYLEVYTAATIYLISTDDKGAVTGAERVEINVHEFTNE